MIHVINAAAMMFMAAIWSKEGVPNILIAMFFAGLAVANCIVASPVVLAWLGR